MGASSTSRPHCSVSHHLYAYRAHADLGPEFVDIHWERGWSNLGPHRLASKDRSHLHRSRDMHASHLHQHAPRKDRQRPLKEAKEFGCRNILASEGDPLLASPSGSPTLLAFPAPRSSSSTFASSTATTLPSPLPAFQRVIRGVDAPRRNSNVSRKKSMLAPTSSSPRCSTTLTSLQSGSKDVRAAGITCPIIRCYAHPDVRRFPTCTARFGTLVPQYFHDALDPVKDDDQKVREIGTRLVGEMCKKIVGTGLASAACTSTP